MGNQQEVSAFRNDENQNALTRAYLLDDWLSDCCSDCEFVC